MKTNEKINVREIPLCMICHDEGTLLYQNLKDCLYASQGTWDIKHCPKCGLAWLSPRPFCEDVKNLYNEYHTHNNPGIMPFQQFALLRNTLYRVVLAAYFGYSNLVKNKVEKIAGSILSRVGLLRDPVGGSVMWLKALTGGKLLDVGCGNGKFLTKMRKLGWDVTGVEPDGQAVKLAREHFGLNIHEGVIEGTGFTDNSFDAITMSHVLEHVWDPISTLRECYRLLKPSGKLVIVTPNINSLGHRLFGKAWRGLEAPRHLYIFSPKALKICIEQANFHILKLRTTAYLARGIYNHSSMIKQNDACFGLSLSKLSFWTKTKGLFFQLLQYVLCQFNDVGEEIVLIATK